MTRPAHAARGLWLLACAAILSMNAVVLGAQQATPPSNPPPPTPEGYVPRGTRPAKGLAPGMKVTDLGKGARTYRVNLAKGDEILSALTEFAEKYHIRSGHFTGLGAINKGLFGWSDVERGLGQKKIELDQEAEIVSFQGSISVDSQGRSTVHGHGSVALSDGSVRGGHWWEAYVSIVAEIFVTEEEGAPAQPAAAQPALAQPSEPSNPEWTKPFPPFRIVGNIYWVGSADLATYLITTPQGHLLVNTGVGDTALQIQKSVHALGFKMSDVKILTATHGHFDHVAGMADLKRMTGAQLVISEPDRELLESGGKADFRWGDVPSARFEPVAVDRTFKDLDKISLGGTELTAHLHAGHTRGATSFTLNVQEAGKAYRVIIANMGSINPGVTVSGMALFPDIGQAYARTFRAQKDLEIDVWLASHAGQFGLHDKYKPGDPYRPDRFVDPSGYLAAVERLEKLYLDQLARERSR